MCGGKIPHLKIRLEHNYRRENSNKLGTAEVGALLKVQKPSLLNMQKFIKLTVPENEGKNLLRHESLEVVPPSAKQLVVVSKLV